MNVQQAAASVVLEGEDADVFAAPAHAAVRLANRSTTKPAFLFQIDDAPLQRKIGIYETFDAQIKARRYSYHCLLCCSAFNLSNSPRVTSWVHFFNAEQQSSRAVKTYRD